MCMHQSVLLIHYGHQFANNHWEWDYRFGNWPGIWTKIRLGSGIWTKIRLGSGIWTKIRLESGIWTKIRLGSGIWTKIRLGSGIWTKIRLGSGIWTKIRLGSGIWTKLNWELAFSTPLHNPHCTNLFHKVHCSCFNIRLNDH